MFEPSVAVAIVSFNSHPHLETCLDTLAAQTQAHQTIVIDNASTDRPLAPLAHRYPAVRFIPLRRNVGFARAVNIAARTCASTADILVTINPDTIPRADFIERLILPLEDASVTSSAGTLLFASRPDTIASAGIRVFRNGVALDSMLGEILALDGQVREVFGASGGAAAYRLDAFFAAGGFCDAFFMYLEDVDLAWRLRLLGGRSMWVPSAVATHVYSAAAGEGSVFKRRLLSRNRLWVLARCLPESFWKRYRFEMAAFDARAMAWAAARRDSALIAGRCEAVARLPARLCERRAIQRHVAAALPELHHWLEPSLPDSELLRLRRLTAQLAGRPAATS